MFDTNLLNTQPGRYALIAESILIPIGILLLGGLWLRPSPSTGEKVKGRPPSLVFGIIWFWLTLIWILALILIAMDTIDVLSVSLIGVFCLFCLFGCILWLYTNKYGPSELKIPGLLIAVSTMITTTIVTLGSSTPSDSKVLAGMFFGFIATWLGIASVLGFVETNLVL